MRNFVWLAVLLAIPLSGCYYPPPYTYYQVPCAPGYAAPAAASAPADTVTPLPPGSAPAPSGSGGSGQTVTPTAPPAPDTVTVNTGDTIQTNCVAAVPNYTYGYYYPGYYGPPVTGSLFVGGRFH